MNVKLFTGVAFAAAIVAVGAQATTITNNEAKVQTFKVYSGDKQQSFTLNPSETVTVDQSLCSDTCILALQNGDEFEISQSDELVLEEGAVYSNPLQQGATGDQGQNRQQ